MKFQLQQKGLFTFYKQQQAIQLQIEKYSGKLKDKAMSQRKIEYSVKRYPQKDQKQQSKTKLGSWNVSKLQQIQEVQRESTKFKKYGAVIVIMNHKQGSQLNRIQRKSERIMNSNNTKDSGCFVLNKNMTFQSPLKQSPKQRQKEKGYKIHSIKRREDSLLSNQSNDKSENKTRLLPSLPKNQTLKQSQTPNKLKTQVNGNVLKSIESGLRKKYQNKASNSKNLQKQEVNRSVSYIQYNKDYNHLTQIRKELLSLQQRKLLQIISRYRRTDF